MKKIALCKNVERLHDEKETNNHKRHQTKQQERTKDAGSSFVSPSNKPNKSNTNRMRPPLSLRDDLDDTETTGGRRKPPRPSTVGIRQSSALRKARRRSSARFLQLKSSSRDDVGSSSSASSNSSGGNLQELYKKAIRMNAENKINASNSWSLRLIENIDNFLEEETEKDVRAEQEEEEQVAEESSTTNQPQDNRRVNFTKASCTLDASVKIYSYRVDDVHLTSYKVLANLHRNSHKDASNKDSADGDANTSSAAAAREKARAPVNTLERNMGTYCTYTLGVLVLASYAPF